MKLSIWKYQSNNGVGWMHFKHIEDCIESSKWMCHESIICKPVSFILKIPITVEHFQLKGQWTYSHIVGKVKIWDSSSWVLNISDQFPFEYVAIQTWGDTLWLMHQNVGEHIRNPGKSFVRVFCRFKVQYLRKVGITSNYFKFRSQDFLSN